MPHAKKVPYSFTKRSNSYPNINPSPRSQRQVFSPFPKEETPCSYWRFYTSYLTRSGYIEQYRLDLNKLQIRQTKWLTKNAVTPKTASTISIELQGKKTPLTDLISIADIKKLLAEDNHPAPHDPQIARWLDQLTGENYLLKELIVSTVLTTSSAILNTFSPTLKPILSGILKGQLKGWMCTEIATNFLAKIVYESLRNLTGWSYFLHPCMRSGIKGIIRSILKNIQGGDSSTPCSFTYGVGKGAFIQHTSHHLGWPFDGIVGSIGNTWVMGFPINKATIIVTLAAVLMICTN